jgi:hypothetical protein
VLGDRYRRRLFCKSRHEHPGFQRWQHNERNDFRRDCDRVCRTLLSDICCARPVADLTHAYPPACRARAEGEGEMIRLPLACACLVAFSLIAEAQSTADVVKRKQDQWMACLKSSFRLYRKQTIDPNAAAERAFLACTTEEDDLRAFSADAGVPRSAFAGLKSATKQVLIEGKN